MTRNIFNLANNRHQWTDDEMDRAYFTYLCIMNRQNDIENGGEGAPLTPIFHKLIIKKKKIELPVCILNIGGISNITAISEHDKNSLKSKDLGPGNCLIDEWIRHKTKNKFDKDGKIAKQGKINKLISVSYTHLTLPTKA